VAFPADVSFIIFLAVFAVPEIDPRARHALAQAAPFDEIFLQPPDLLIQQIIGLVNQADRNILPCGGIKPVP